MGKLWMVCSGNGGTGKSTIAAALASGAAKAGKSTILLDASGLSRSCDLVLGLESIVALDLADVITQQAGINSALYPVPRYSGLSYACALLGNSISTAELSGIILVLHSMCDILVIDMPTGACDSGGILRKDDEVLFVVRPDDASLRSAERLMMSSDSACTGLILNRVSRDRIKKKTQYAKDTVQLLMDRSVIACIPEDASIPSCEKSGRTAIECDGPAWTAIKELLHSLLGT